MARCITPLKASAFTLLELLMIVATIAILAAIAVPNFLEAQVRSKHAAARGNMAGIAAGLAAYYADHQAYPTNRPDYPPGRTGWQGAPARDSASGMALYVLTSPIAYFGIDSLEGGNANDPFSNERGTFVQYRNLAGAPFTEAERAQRYYLASNGPDHDPWDDGIFPTTGDLILRKKYTPYDPTNGTITSGGLFHFATGPVVPPALMLMDTPPAGAPLGGS